MSSKLETSLLSDLNDDLEAQLGKTTKWATSYGDLMSALMILFLLLFSFAVIGGVEGKIQTDRFQQAFGAEPDEELAKSIKQFIIEQDIADEIHGFIESHNLSKSVNIAIDDYQIKVTLTQAVMFPSGSSILSPICFPVLAKLSTLISNIDNRIEIEGHTDNIPLQHGSNFDLSSKRAQAVLQYLIETEKLSSARFSISGYGSHKPIVPNNSNLNRSKNRRVEINIIRHTNFSK